MNFSKLGVAKILISGVVGIGTGKIVGKVIKNNISADTLVDKVTVTAAAWVIGAIATERTKAYTNDMIDDLAKNACEIIDKVKLADKLGRINRNQSTFQNEGLNISDFHKNENGKWVPNEPKIDTDEK